MAKDKTERQEYEWDMREDMEVQNTKDSEKDMERKLEGAIEQMKILNLDFGRVCVDRNVSLGIDPGYSHLPQSKTIMCNL
jgi:hypothetical protein